MFITGAITAVFIGVPLLVVGVGLLVWARSVDARASRARSWPTVEGSVTASDVEAYRSARDRSDPHTTHMTLYRPQLTYEYSVDGQKLLGSQLSLGATVGHSARSVAEAVAARYAVGSRVTVYVDPSDPRNACLDPRARGSRWIRIVGWVLIAAAAVAVAATLAFVTALEGFVGSAGSG